MNVGDKVQVNVNENILDPDWQEGTIESIYITYDKNFYSIILDNGTRITVEGKYIQEE